MDKQEMNIDPLFQNIAQLIEKGQQTIIRSINYSQLYVNYHIGKYIVDDEQDGIRRAQYGKRLIKTLSERLTSQYGMGFSAKNLELMRNFFLLFSKSQTLSALLEPEQNKTVMESDAISQTVSAKLGPGNRPVWLSWSHYVFLMQVENLNERSFYEIEALQQNWSLREMKRQFNSGLFERLALSRDKDGIRKLAKVGQVIEKPVDVLKEPLILEFLNLKEQYQYSEKELETAIIDRIQEFMLELGKGFLFEARQKRITINEKHYHIDLTFYNRLLNCFVLIDLKIGELTHQDIGQMQMYVNYYDRFIIEENENQTIGIVLCKQKDQTLVEMTLPVDNNQIFAAKYQTVLPNKEQLKQILEEGYNG